MTAAAPRHVDSFPEKVRKIEHVWSPMPDGVRLPARIQMPEGVEEKPVPAILEYIPYRRRDGTRLRASRTVGRDMATGPWTMRLVEDGGRRHIVGIDLDAADGMACDYVIDEDDPPSAEAVRRWRSATATGFLIDTDVEAREHGQMVCSRSWRHKVPRDGA